MIIIGITGGIASGKSATSKYIKSLAYKLYDCDTIAHDIFDSNEVQKEIASTFNINGDIKREEISKIVFNDKNKMEELNNIMRKRITLKMIEILNSDENNKEELVFFDVPLLYEWHLYDMFKYVIFVYVDRNTQIERLVNRDKISKEYALKKLEAQIDIEDKFTLAERRHDLIIDNNADLANLYKEIDRVLREIKNDF